MGWSLFWNKAGPELSGHCRLLQWSQSVQCPDLKDTISNMSILRIHVLINQRPSLGTDPNTNLFYKSQHLFSKLGSWQWANWKCEQYWCHSTHVAWLRQCIRLTFFIQEKVICDNKFLNRLNHSNIKPIGGLVLIALLWYSTNQWAIINISG